MRLEVVDQSRLRQRYDFLTTHLNPSKSIEMSRILLYGGLGINIEIASIANNRFAVLESIQQKKHLTFREMRGGFGKDLLKFAMRKQAI
ncbi:hypothetical protein D9M69_710800 [compost metagenome]